MALEQYFQEAVAPNDSNGEYGASIEKWKSVSPTVDGCENNHSGGFDCNICLDFVQDPVVTLCGHLYCWPCIYKWIHFQSIPSENPKQQLPHPQCPVCKTEISQRNIVPLYGRGQSTKPSEGKAPHLGIVVPSRPPSPRACGSNTPITTATTGSQLLHRSYPQQFQRYHSNPGSYAATPMLSLGSTMRADMVHPTVAMFVEMIYARIFGNSETTMFAYPNSYQLAGSNSPRVRRHIIQTDQSLSRVFFFLCCCLVLCLLLF